MGCDKVGDRVYVGLTGFNPRTRVGCDAMVNFDFLGWLVSIHAPVWGATMAFRHLALHFAFQSTHPCGVRLIRFQLGF